MINFILFLLILSIVGLAFLIIHQLSKHSVVRNFKFIIIVSTLVLILSIIMFKSKYYEEELDNSNIRNCEKIKGKYVVVIYCESKSNKNVTKVFTDINTYSNFDNLNIKYYLIKNRFGFEIDRDIKIEKNITIDSLDIK